MNSVSKGEKIKITVIDKYLNLTPIEKSITLSSGTKVVLIKELTETELIDLYTTVTTDLPIQTKSSSNDDKPKVLLLRTNNGTEINLSNLNPQELNELSTHLSNTIERNIDGVFVLDANDLKHFNEATGLCVNFSNPIISKTTLFQLYEEINNIRFIDDDEQYKSIFLKIITGYNLIQLCKDPENSSSIITLDLIQFSDVVNVASVLEGICKKYLPYEIFIKPDAQDNFIKIKNSVVFTFTSDIVKISEFRSIMKLIIDLVTNSINIETFNNQKSQYQTKFHLNLVEGIDLGMQTMSILKLLDTFISNNFYKIGDKILQELYRWDLPSTFLHYTIDAYHELFQLHSILPATFYKDYNFLEFVIDITNTLAIIRAISVCKAKTELDILQNNGDAFRKDTDHNEMVWDLMNDLSTYLTKKYFNNTLFPEEILNIERNITHVQTGDLVGRLDFIQTWVYRLNTIITTFFSGEPEVIKFLLIDGNPSNDPNHDIIQRIAFNDIVSKIDVTDFSFLEDFYQLMLARHKAKLDKLEEVDLSVFDIEHLRLLY